MFGFKGDATLYFMLCYNFHISISSWFRAERMGFKQSSNPYICVMLNDLIMSTVGRGMFGKVDIFPFRGMKPIYGLLFTMLSVILSGLE